MRRALAFIPGVIFAGCAALPTDLPPRPAIMEPEASRTVAALAHEAHTVPADTSGEPWWRAFAITELSQLEEQALQANPDLVTATARLEAASRAESLARLDAGVHYSTDASVVRQRLSENGIFPPPIGGSTFTQSDLNQSFAYTLDPWGRKRSLLQAAGAETRVARAQDEAVRLTLTAAVADAYFAWADGVEELALVRAMADRHQREYEFARSRFDLGLDGSQQVHDARQRLDLDADRLHGLEYLDRANRYRLAALLGLDPDHATQLPEPRLADRVPTLPSSLPLDALAHRPDVLARRAGLDAAEAKSAASRAEFYPNIDLKATIGLESLDLATLLKSGSLAYAVGPALHLPLFNARTLQAQLGMREADVSAAVGDYNHAILEAARQVADRYALNTSLDRREVAQRHALDEMTQTRNLTDKRLALGLARPQEAVESELAVLDQQLNATRLRASRLRARVALAEALGGQTHVGKE